MNTKWWEERKWEEKEEKTTGKIKVWSVEMEMSWHESFNKTFTLILKFSLNFEYYLFHTSLVSECFLFFSIHFPNPWRTICYHLKVADGGNDCWLLTLRFLYNMEFLTSSAFFFFLLNWKVYFLICISVLQYVFKCTLHIQYTYILHGVQGQLYIIALEKEKALCSAHQKRRYFLQLTTPRKQN